MSKEKEKMRFVRFNRDNGEDRGVRLTNYNDKEIEFNIHRFDTKDYWTVGPEVTLNTEDHMVSFALGLFWWNIRVGFEWSWLRNHFNKLTAQTRETGLTVSVYRIALKLLHVDDSWMDAHYWLKSKGWDVKLAKKGWVRKFHKNIVNGWSFDYWWFKFTNRSYYDKDRRSGILRLGDVDGYGGDTIKNYPDIHVKWDLCEIEGTYDHWLSRLITSNNKERLFRLGVDATHEELGDYRATFPATRGKGENGWDCDDDIFIPQISFGGEESEEFIRGSLKLSYLGVGRPIEEADAISMIDEIPENVIEFLAVRKIDQALREDISRRGKANDYAVTIENGKIMNTEELVNEDTYGSH